MPMNVTTAPTAPLSRPSTPAQAPAAPEAITVAASPTTRLVGDQVATSVSTGSLSTSSLTLAAARGNTVTQGNNNVTIVNNFDVELDAPRPKPAVEPKGAGKPQRKENAIELIARGLGKLLNTITFGFFSALGRGFRGETPQEA